MTHHYNIEIISTKTTLKATYRNGKFRKLEHLRGKLDREIMDALGKVIPVTEAAFSHFNKKWLNKVNYEIEVKNTKSLYSQFLQEWFKFYEDLTDLKPKFTGADGNALKQIINYLKKQSTNDGEALATWQLILDSWGELNEFHQQNTDLKYINSKLNVIIREIKQKKSTNVSGTNRNIEL